MSQKQNPVIKHAHRAAQDYWLRHEKLAPSRKWLSRRHLEAGFEKASYPMWRAAFMVEQLRMRSEVL